jgi:hypothetical protein
MFFLDLLHSAKLQPRTAPGFFCRQSGFDELGDLLLEMKVQLLVDFCLNMIPAEEGSKP